MFVRMNAGLALVPVPAAPADPGPIAVIHRVFTAPDPGAALAALAPAERIAFDAGYVPDHVELVGVETRPAPRGCEYSRAKKALKAAGGNALGTYWTEIHWCYDKKRGWHNTFVTDSGTGGETHTPGYTYRGNPEFDAGVVGTSRGWAKHWFEARFLPDSYPCLRVYLTNVFEPGSDDSCSLA
ncbi:hypothetical protein GCM10010123_14460 [Pilimelia anulata]|uniref:Uncharacterized protein n=1 Tax=Pilimelia anulata TaxID=53371 RepID=A0A8J3F761_9ACTN|nr:hypothetical protein [Pilimelia anulata]GGJ85935.1 hypothetical protein GCM10010123_14460 [Pilimelia anulata]